MMERRYEVVLTFHVLMLIMLTVSVTSQTPMPCFAPPLPAGNNHTDRSFTVFKFGSTITYSCAVGYYIVASTTRECQANGTWTGVDRVCRIDAASIALACGAGLAAILIFATLSCYLIIRSRSIQRRAQRRLTIRGDTEQADGAGRNRPAAYENGNLYATSSKKNKARVDRSDSGLQTDVDMEEIDLNDFALESPTDNNPQDEFDEIEWDDNYS